MASREHKKVPTSKAADLCMTPAYALDPLLPFLPSRSIIWESARGSGTLAIALKKLGYAVVATDIVSGQDFFKIRPDFDIQLTNPPFSRKLDWLHRSYELNKPFALLLPVEILGVGQAQRMFEKFGVEIILLNRRVDFATVNTSFAKSSAWFPVAWFCWKLEIGQQITYGNITKRPNEQLTMFTAA